MPAAPSRIASTGPRAEARRPGSQAAATLTADPDHHADQGRPEREAERLQVEVEERLDHAQAHARDQPPDDEAHEARRRSPSTAASPSTTRRTWRGLRAQRAQDAVGRRPLGHGHGEGEEHEEPADEHGDHRHQRQARR